jgi:3-oxoacyl-ACP reductase-like protein
MSHILIERYMTGCVLVTLSGRSIAMMGTLTGKVALVTGGSRSIGAAIVKRLAADGAAVALTYSASPEGR